MKRIFIIPLVFISFNIVGQNTNPYAAPSLPGVTMMKTPTYQQSQVQRPQFDPRNINDPFGMGDYNQIQRQNQQIMEEAEEYERRTVERNQPQSDIQMLASNGFSSQSYQQGTSNYYTAFEEINNMLDDKQPINLGRAIFLVENAYYNNTLNYDDYQKTITDQIKICNEKMREEKLNKESNLAKNMMLFRLVSDTLKIKPNGTERPITHYPIKYDLSDYKSEKHFDSHFVTKLMKSGTGQCMSMPLYYLVLAEKIGAKAYLAYSPHHSFIKIQDNDGAWYNLELTCNAVLSDAHYMNSGYIKAEAIRSRIYLDPMDKKEVVAQMLAELASGYYEKYGLDNFYLNCANTAINHSNNHLQPLIQKAFYEERLTATLAKLLQAPKPEIMQQKSPEAYKHYEKTQELYNQIDNLGYEETPAAIYATWLEHINDLKAKENKRKSLMKLSRK
jgi:hypothetical protein